MVFKEGLEEARMEFLNLIEDYDLQIKVCAANIQKRCQYHGSGIRQRDIQRLN